MYMRTCCQGHCVIGVVNTARRLGSESIVEPALCPRVVCLPPPDRRPLLCPVRRDECAKFRVAVSGPGW